MQTHVVTVVDISKQRGHVLSPCVRESFPLFCLKQLLCISDMAVAWILLYLNQSHNLHGSSVSIHVYKSVSASINMT